MARDPSTGEHTTPSDAACNCESPVVSTSITTRAMERVLIVEDDRLVLKSLVRSLRRAQFEVDVTSDWMEGVQRWRTSPYLVALIDWKLGTGDGLALARQLRDSAPYAAIVMISAHAKPRDICRALEIVDDYLIKPFTGGELVARIRARLRRSTRVPASSQQVPIGRGCLLDLENSCLLTQDGVVALTRGELTVLRQLDQARGTWQTTSDLAKALGRTDAEGQLLVWQYMSRLRTKLGAASRTLEHTRNLGYRLR